MTVITDAVILILIAMVLFSLLDATVKYLTSYFAVSVLVWTRYSLHCLLMMIFVAPSMGSQLIRTQHPILQIVRALMLLATTGFGFAAFSTMPLAETTAVVFLSPILVALLAGPCLGEEVHQERWIALLAGFLGVLLIAHPGGMLTVGGVLWAIGAAISYAIYQIMTRRLSSTEHPMTLLFYTALVGTVVMSVALLVLPVTWPHIAPTQAQWAMMGSLGILGGAGHYLLIRAFRLAPASTLSPFLYVQLIWATLLGWLIFNHIPDVWTTIGMVVIAASGLWIAFIEHKTKAKTSPAPQDAGKAY